MHRVIDRRHLLWPLKVVARPATDADPTELERLIAELSADDPAFMAIHEADSASVLVGADHELQLEENVTLLQGKLPGGLQLGPPLVGYRETISQEATVDHIHKAMSGDDCQFARVVLAVEPLNPRFDFQFENKAADSAVPKHFVPGVEKGIQSLLNGGLWSEFPIIGLKACLLNGAYHNRDSSALAFEIASRAAFREATLKAGPVLLEPVSKLTLVTPDDTMGALMADLTGRRSQVLQTVSRDGSTTLEAFIPTANFFGYSNTLKAITQGRASFSTAFSHYQRVPDTKGDGPPWPEPASAALRP